MIEQLGKTPKKTVHPQITRCCEALKPTLSYYFCLIQVLSGTFWEIWQIQI